MDRYVMSAFRNLANQRFGRLIGVCPTKERSKRGYVIWLCRCDCGNLTHVRSSRLLSGNTQSCGCFYNEKSRERATNNKWNLRHGDAVNKNILPPYGTWNNMDQRCSNPNHPAYKRYGGRGVAICEEWKSYPVFKEWALANGYTNNLTIDRINNDGNYEPSNCQWLTRAENSKKGMDRRVS